MDAVENVVQEMDCKALKVIRVRFWLISNLQCECVDKVDIPKVSLIRFLRQEDFLVEVFVVSQMADATVFKYKKKVPLCLH